MQKTLMEIYHKMLNSCGPQHWWPADEPFEVIIGAILTQNTNWSNVEKAINNLKAEKLLTPKQLVQIDIKKLAQLIKPAGYFNIKTKRLKNFLKWFTETYEGNIKTLLKQPKNKLREELLSVNGIGRETADSIVLYAAGQPSFVIDTYTYRIFARHKLIPEETSYDEIKTFFEDGLPEDASLFNEYHALIVKIGKEYCKKTNPLCDGCPLKGINNFPEE